MTGSPHPSPIPRRLLAAIVAGALLALLPLVGAQAQEARDIDEACATATESEFTDREEGAFGEAVDCIAWYGVAQGFPDGEYKPGRVITRAQMATFLVNTLRVAGTDLPEDPPDAFTDDDNSVHEDNINIAAELGVTSGVGGGRFAPNNGVRRDQMASFIAQQIEAAIGEELPDASGDHFEDDTDNTHEDNINKLADAGIVSGVAEGQYNPSGMVTRRQMALFIARDLDFMTEDHSVPLRRIGVGPAVTDAPDLLTVTEISVDSSQATLEFEFDEDVTAVDADGFAIYSISAERTPATAAQVATGNSAAVRASFPRAAYDVATVAGVANAAVESPSPESLANPEGSAPIQDVEVPGGVTSAPDLVSITNLSSGTSATFRFDEDATSTAGDGYHLVLSNGEEVVSTAVSSGDGTTSHTVTFPAFTASQVVRGYVTTGTVEDADGNPNAQQAAAVASQGRTGTPDLVEIRLLPDDNQVEFVFDQSVTLPASNPLMPAPPFRIYYLDGSEVTADSRAKKAGQEAVVIATFGAGEVNETIAGGSVDEDSVDNGAGDEVGRSAAFAAGQTAAPKLISAGRTESAGPLNTTNRSVVFTFDKEVSLEDDTQFFVYEQNGARTVMPSALESGCSASGNEVTCTANDGDAGEDFEAVGNAVLATVGQGAVADATGAYFSNEGAAVL